MERTALIIEWGPLPSVHVDPFDVGADISPQNLDDLEAAVQALFGPEDSPALNEMSEIIRMLVRRYQVAAFREQTRRATRQRLERRPACTRCGRDCELKDAKANIWECPDYACNAGARLCRDCGQPMQQGHCTNNNCHPF